MNVTNRKNEQMVVEIVGTREELDVLADVLMNELNWEAVEDAYGVTHGFFTQLYDLLTEDAE